MLLDQEINIGKLPVQNRLVMPPMQTNKTEAGHVTDALVDYYRERAVGSRPGIIITEHSCVASNARAAETQLSIAADDMIPEHRRLTDAIHEGGCKAFVQLNHAGSNGIDESVSASNVNIPTKKLSKRPKELVSDEILAIEAQFAKAAGRAIEAGYDGVEIHCAHAYLLNQFYSPMINKRTDKYGGSLENRLRFLVETVGAVRRAVGVDVPIAVRLGGADYLPGGSKEEDAVEAAILLEKAGIDLLDISGGMCFFLRPGHLEPGYFSSMTEKIKAKVSIPVLLTGGIKKVEDAERLLTEGKADMIGVGRALMKDARWKA
jgi:2,4-dienoyl-CoA reductase-like NADH-dependent reductase (Old Yellow Enzyme family)